MVSAPRQEGRVAFELIVALEHGHWTMEPHSPNLLIVLELIGWPKHPNGHAFGLPDQSQKIGLLNRNIQVTARLRRLVQRLPQNVLVLDHRAARRVDGHIMSATGELARAAHDARLGTSQRTPVEITAIVTGRAVGNDYARHSKSNLNYRARSPPFSIARSPHAAQSFPRLIESSLRCRTS